MLRKSLVLILAVPLLLAATRPNESDMAPLPVILGFDGIELGKPGPPLLAAVDGFGGVRVEGRELSTYEYESELSFGLVTLDASVLVVGLDGVTSGIHVSMNGFPEYKLERMDSFATALGRELIRKYGQRRVCADSITSGRRGHDREGYLSIQDECGREVAVIWDGYDLVLIYSLADHRETMKGHRTSRDEASKNKL